MCSKSASLSLALATFSQRPRADDAGRTGIPSDRAVVDDREPTTIRPDAVDTPVRIPVIRLANLVPLANSFLDLESGQASLSETKLGVVSPDEATFEDPLDTLVCMECGLGHDDELILICDSKLLPEINMSSQASAI